MLQRLYLATDTILFKFIGDVKPIKALVFILTPYYQVIFDLRYRHRKYVQKVS